MLIGSAALGTYDQKTTPFSANFPGVEKNATIVENIVRGEFLAKGVWAEPLDTGLIVLFVLGLGYWLPRMRARPGALLALSVFMGYGVLA